MVDQAISRTPEATAPAGNWLPALALAWLIPGAGHFMLKRPMRALLVFASVMVMFLLGLMMRGPLFEPQGGDMLTMVIYYGGYLCHILTGIPYILTKALGYSQPDVAGHVHDYGAKFLVGAGLLNVLAMVDVYEIGKGKKD